jgi:cystathionine beta-lyase family protein involved in aluminum resistance
MNNIYKKIDTICQINTERVLEAFRINRVSEAMLHGTTGYGYDDRGRDTLDSVFAYAFGAEDALVRHTFVSGTHTLATALFGVLRPGDTILSVTGQPYDTLCETFGITGYSGNGSMKDFSISYKEIELDSNGHPQLEIMKKMIKDDPSIKLVFMQRSRGYTSRRTLSLEDIKAVAEAAKSVRDVIVFVDNCYGEFVREKEPIAVGVDLMAGSLIKNPGGGIARTGGYICGKKALVELCAYRLTAVGIGKECGATLDELRNMFQGFFMAPHIVAQALKTAVYAAEKLSKAGFCVSPLADENREDIIQTVTFGNPDDLLAFCRGIQHGSPVDSFVTPEPWAMPGYDCDVVMAAGGFISGSSIEISADAPLKPPYTAYMQGGLTFESGKYAVDTAIKYISELR